MSILFLEHAYKDNKLYEPEVEESEKDCTKYIKYFFRIFNNFIEDFFASGKSFSLIKKHGTSPLN